MSETEQHLSEEQSRNRLIGAIVWLGLLVIIVPIWYSNPVNFKPHNYEFVEKVSVPIVDQPFTLPKQANKAENTDQSIESKKVDVKVQEKPKEAKKTLKNNQVWLIRLIAYRDKEKAEAMKKNLQYDYEAFIKYFPKSKYYSVRVGPYESLAQAEKDQQELNRLLRLKSELVKIQPSDLKAK